MQATSASVKLGSLEQADGFFANFSKKYFGIQDLKKGAKLIESLKIGGIGKKISAKDWG